MTFAAFLIVGCFAVGTAQAQAGATATRSLGISAFGGATILKLDYGATYKTYEPGFVVGGDATHPLGPVYLSIEPRFGHTSSSTDSQSYFLGDIKAERAFGPGHRFHPYAIGGIGYGAIHFVTGYHDNSVIYAVDGGLDYDVTSHWAVKGDWQYQFWHLGHTSSGMNPNGFTAAVVYRFNFGSLRTGR